MKKINLSRISIYGSISTYDSFAGKGQVIIDVIEEFADKIAKPLNKKLIYNCKGKGMQHKEYKFDSSDWAGTKLLLLNNGVDKIHMIHIDEAINEAIGNNPDSELGQMSPEFIVLNFITEPQKLNQASLIEFSVTTFLYDGYIPEYVKNAFINIITYLNNRIKSSGGFITVDSMPVYEAFSAHERYIALNYLFASKQFNRYFRGYFWGNFLSATHVELLGGIQFVEKNAPVYLVKNLSDGGAFLQLTENINNVSDNDLRKLKKFFLPILPKARLRLSPSEATFRRIIIDDDDEENFLPIKKT
ncbi:hypothetical protein RBH29_17145, partial [Herbivorax sp. ANBcel31]|uniref:hypothetical protein n=1 Tax=Herbivorax sp. ANBcel31 TaxID=3069754 RepID=UPI0027B20B37